MTKRVDVWCVACRHRGKVTQDRWVALSVEHDVWDVTHPVDVVLGDGTVAKPVHRIQPVRVTAGPGDVGTVFGGLVYHNFYSTRFDATPDGVLDAVVGRNDPKTAWDEALAKYYVGG